MNKSDARHWSQALWMIYNETTDAAEKRFYRSLSVYPISLGDDLWFPGPAYNPECPSCRHQRGRYMEEAKTEAKASKEPVTITEWIISRSIAKSDLSKGGVGLVYHVQARTADQFSSFATLASERAPITRQKGADGVVDVFTCMSDQGHTTMNIVGKIRYEGDWPK